jgi:hypothetical protein
MLAELNSWRPNEVSVMEDDPASPEDHMWRDNDQPTESQNSYFV